MLLARRAKERHPQMVNKTYPLWKILLLILLINTDVFLTYVGLKMGFSEGNPIASYVIKHLGLNFGLLLILLISFMVVIAFLKMFLKLKNQKTEMIFEVALDFIILVRVYAIGQWMALLG